MRPKTSNDWNSLCKNAENQLILSDININKIKIFDLSGNLETIVGSPESGTPLESPDRIYMCPRTRVMVVFERPPYRMIKVLVALFPITSFSYEATNPEDICMDSSFKIFLLDSPSKIIYIYDTTGVLLNVLHCPDFLYPCNIDVNQHEELFVCDKERHCVEVINYKGKKLRTIGGEGITDFPIFAKNPSFQMKVETSKTISGILKLDNSDTTAENESTEDDIWDMSFVTNVKVKNEELFDNILAQCQRFESCEKMLFEKGEYALPVESGSVEKDITFTEHVGLNNDESFNHIPIVKFLVT
ncbi:hypothetical protein HELRODRAFT_172964 [Helobdella robusta]|uniref:Uncharacterized protein n=1 Tax=Helobdella robusta TaxID=6412 RepID=T1F680_HELRO|nr:hypothetical protein HELRODRAFT_172964 [Helobdella robusta]ESO03934.1 hypothetical protein HELRODRAFT_172964 [Helobdella robusta]